MRKATVIMVVCAATAFATGQVLIEKSLPVSFGVDSHGGNRLEGRFIDARVYSRAWTASEAAAYAKDASTAARAIAKDGLVWRGVPTPGDTCNVVKEADYSKGFTFACWVVLNKTGGRLIDNTTGGRDGWLIDTWPDRPRFYCRGERVGGFSKPMSLSSDCRCCAQRRHTRRLRRTS